MRVVLLLLNAHGKSEGSEGAMWMSVGSFPTEGAASAMALRQEPRGGRCDRNRVREGESGSK